MKISSKITSLLLSLSLLVPVLTACGNEQTATDTSADSIASAPIDTSTQETEAESKGPSDPSTDEPLSIPIVSVMPEVVFPESVPISEGSCCYVSASLGNDDASGKDPSEAVKTLDRAYAIAEEMDADNVRIILCDTYTLTDSYKEPAHKKNVTLSADGGKLALTGNYRFALSGNTTFDDITIEFKGTVNFVANYNYIRFGKNVHLNKTGSGNGAYVVGGYQSPSAKSDLSKSSHIRIDGGEFWAVIGGSRQTSSSAGNMTFTGYQYVEVNGGKISTLYGGTTSNHTSKNAYIKVNGGEINELCAAGEVTRSLSGDAVILLAGGSVDLVNVNNVYGNATVIHDNKCAVRSANVSYYDLDIRAKATAQGGAKIFVYTNEDRTEADILSLSEKFDAALPYSVYTSETKASENVIYVSGSGKGSGASPSEPTSLSKALKSVKEDATVVIVGITEINASITYSHTGTLTFTSKYGGVDYAKTNNAALVMSSGLTLGGETLFEHIEIHSTASYKAIYAKNHPLTVGDGVVCLKIGESATFMSLMGGSNNAHKDEQSSLTVNSGTWQRVRGGTAASGSTNYKVSLTVNGGRFADMMTLGSSQSHSGDIVAVINGGVFFGGISATGINKAQHTHLIQMSHSALTAACSINP